jgi:hypothetical protein
MKAPRSAPTEARPYPRGVLKPSVRQLADLPIWILQSPTGRSLNCILISGPTGLVLVNTGVSHRHGAAISAAVSGLTDQPLNTIIYPHHPTTSCQGTSAATGSGQGRCGKVVILAAGHRGTHQHPGVAPNLLIVRECILELSGVIVRDIGPRAQPPVRPRRAKSMRRHPVMPAAQPQGGGIPSTPSTATQRPFHGTAAGSADRRAGRARVALRSRVGPPRRDRGRLGQRDRRTTLATTVAPVLHERRPSGDDPSVVE